MNIRLLIYGLLLVLLGASRVNAQFTCDPIFFQIIEDDLQQLDTSTGNYTDLPGSSGQFINAAGYNRNDDFIYGLGVGTGSNPSDNQLYRVDDQGNAIIVSDNSTFSENSVAGDVDASNQLWFRDSGNQGRNLKRIPLPSASGPLVLVTASDVISESYPNGDSFLPGQVGGIGDIVYIAAAQLGTATDYIFSVSEDGFLLTWDISTSTATRKTIDGFAYGGTSAASGTNLVKGSSGLFGAGWTDLNGNLFFSNNGTSPAQGSAQAAVWQITNLFGPGNPLATWLIDSQLVGANDGAGCPLAASPIENLPTDCTEPTAISFSGASSAVINQGQTAAFSITGGLVGGNPADYSWVVTPTTGVSPSSGSGSTSTGNITFSNTGSYTLTYTASNDSDPTGCNSTEISTADASITVNSSGPIDDGDGVDAAIEDAGPNGGDGNGDGTPDSQQPNVTSLPDLTGSNYVTIELDAAEDCAVLTNVSLVAETDLSQQDPDYNYPLGLVDFTATCISSGGSANVTFYWHGILSMATYRKFGSSAPGAMDASFKNFAANLGSQVIGLNTVATSSYRLTDGVVGDDSAVPMEIVDPTGPGFTIADNDGDSVLDADDLDDDNDGILDTNEDDCIFSFGNWSPYYDHNDITGPPAATDYDLTPKYQSPSFVTSPDASLETIGSGLTLEPFVSNQTYLQLSGVDQTNLLEAIVDEDYVAYNFTTNNTQALGVINNFTESVIDPTMIGPPLPAQLFEHKIAAVIATQSDFSDQHIVLQDYTISNVPHGFAITPVPNPYILQPNTTYYVRVYLYDAPVSAANRASYDDFGFLIGSCSALSDVDGDGIPNRYDLDSDGDSCPDAVEGGASFVQSDLQISNIRGGSTNIQSNLTGSLRSLADPVAAGIVDSSGRVTEVNGSAPSPSPVDQSVGGSQNASINGGCLDTDGDLIIDSVDLDDDNDGILDEDECREPTVTAAIIDGVEDGNFPVGYWDLEYYSGHFGIAGSTFGSSSTDNTITGANGTPTFLGEAALGINSFVLTDSRSYTTSQTATSTGVVPANYVGANLDASNGYYQILFNRQFSFAGQITVGGPGFGVDDVFEVIVNGVQVIFKSFCCGATSSPNTADTVAISSGDMVQLRYTNLGGIGSYNFNNIVFVPVCADDVDGDGIVNSLDLDSDGDGCPDAVEGGDRFREIDLADAAMVGSINGGNSGMGFNGTAVTGVTNNLTGNYGGVSDPVASNYVDSSGRVTISNLNGTSPGVDSVVEQTVDVSQNLGLSACLDTDGDAVADYEDLDDDNDGILDSLECTYAIRNCLDWTGTNDFNTRSGTIIDSETGNTINVSFTGTLWNFDFYAPASGASSINDKAGIDGFCTEFTGVIGNDGDILLFNFSQPLSNPTFQISSLGASGNTVTHTILGDGSPIPIILNTIHSASVDLTPTVSQNQITGNEAVVEYVVPGTYSQISLEVETQSSDAYMISIVSTACEDTDMDGIDDVLDLDSDGDGCPDAVEGDGSFTIADLVAASGTGLDVPNNNQVNGTLPSGSIIDNLGTTSDSVNASTLGVPLTGVSSLPNTQGIGASQDISNDSSCCFITPPTIAPN